MDGQGDIPYQERNRVERGESYSGGPKQPLVGTDLLLSSCLLVGPLDAMRLLSGDFRFSKNLGPLGRKTG